MNTQKWKFAMYWVKLFEGKWKGLSRKCDYRGTKVSGFFRIVKRKSTILLNLYQVLLTFFYPLCHCDPGLSGEAI
jgi:hypothetical protein